MNRTLISRQVSVAGRLLVAGLVAVLMLVCQAAIPALAEPGVPGQTVDNGDGTATYTHWDGETVTYPTEVVWGESIVLSGTGFQVKPEYQEETLNHFGSAGSAIGFKLNAGSVSTTEQVISPLNGDALTNATIWDVALAEDDGSWSVALAWPTVANSSLGQDWQVGQTHEIQLLTGTIYRLASGVALGDPTQGPDVSRTAAFPFTIVSGEEVPEPELIAPSVITQPGDQTVSPGATATFTAAANGSDPITVQWHQAPANQPDAWQDISGATSTTLTVSASTADSGTRYRAQFSNEAGVALSDPAVLTVSAVDPTPDPDPDPEPGNTAPIVVTPPASAAVIEGQSASFTAVGSGTPTPTVHWQRSTDAGQTWVNVRGATTDTYVVDSPALAHSGWQYRAVFTNSAGTATSGPATLRVSPASNLREFCGASYGPGAPHTGVEFCFQAPEKVVYGEPIVIQGTSGYLATDDATGSVVNFFLNHAYSSDPNGVYTRTLRTNPATGQTMTDRRTYWIIQARPDGSWRAEIPFPTVDSVSPAADGSTRFTEQELRQLFAPGSTHSLRMLSGSLLNSPADRQRGASAYFTIVDSLDDVVPISEPIYEHQTWQSTVAGDAATAWLQQNVGSGGTGNSAELSGTGWLTQDSAAGSTIDIRLYDQDGNYYERAAGQRPDASDATVWQRVAAYDSGAFRTAIEYPAGLGAGDYLAVEVRTHDDGTALGDVARTWRSEPLTIDGRAYVPPIDGNATCVANPTVASYELAPGMALPAANVGGSIRLVGKDWCNLIGGGSLIGVKLNAGGFSHKGDASAPHWDANLDASGRAIGEIGPSPSGTAKTNKTIWYVIEADKFGAFDVNIPLPDRSNSVPAFGEGSYTLQLLTRTVAVDPYYAGTRPDPSRSITTEEFTVVAEGQSLEGVKPGKPTAVADPLHVTEDLSDSARGGVTVDQQANQWVVSVPSATAGDWVYVNVYDGASPRFPWGTEWFEVDARKQVTVPMTGATLPVGTNKLSVQTRTGALLGWAPVTVAAPPAEATTDDAASTPGATAGGTTTSSSPVRSVSATLRKTATTTTPKPKPTATPKAPVAAYADLTETNAGGVKAVEAEGKLTVTIPTAAPGSWVFLYLYTETDRVLPVGWVQVGTAKTVTVDISKLPDGIHKLALVGEDEKLIGWVTANGPNPLAEDEDAPVAEPVSTSVQESIADPSSDEDGDQTLTLILIAASVLVLAGSAAGVVMLRTPVVAKK